jgi:hypothetical protein
MSMASASGCSSAAKWPPLAIDTPSGAHPAGRSRRGASSSIAAFADVGSRAYHIGWNLRAEKKESWRLGRV